MNILLVLPLLIPLTTAAFCLLAWKRPRVQQYLSIFGVIALLATATAILLKTSEQGILTTQPGDWPAPFGITIVADLTSAVLTFFAALMGLLVMIYASATIDRRRVAFGFYPISQILLMGVCGAFLTGDIFNLYVWFEVMLMASFVLMALGGERAQLEGAIKYVTLNLLASTLFLSATGLLYALVGTLNMADLAFKLQGAPHSGLITTLSMLFLVSFGIKAGLFPLYFWLPASYHTPPFAVSAIFAGLLTKVGVYVLIRVFTLIFTGDPSYTHTIILILAALTMVSGVLGALAQTEVRRTLSFLLISGVGFSVLGLGLLTAEGLSASIFYMMHSIVVITALFLMCGVLKQCGVHKKLHLSGGLYAKQPFVAILFLVPALSLAGIPPFSGFVGKLALLRAALQTEHYVIAGIILGVSLLTILAITRIWSEVFWKEPPAHPEVEALAKLTAEKPVYIRPRVWIPIAALGVLTITIGLGAGPIWTYAQRAGTQLSTPSIYVGAVLGPEAAQRMIDRQNEEEAHKDSLSVDETNSSTDVLTDQKPASVGMENSLENGGAGNETQSRPDDSQ
jgi:multicomponent Na+:H+ antiporter subunit D